MGILPDFEDNSLFRRAKVEAWKTVIGGVVAAFVFSFIQKIGRQNYSYVVELALIAAAVIIVYLAVYSLAIFFYRTELNAPPPEVELAEPTDPVGDDGS